MKATHQKNENIIHKDVIVIGNGPSGIIISLLLSGNLPYLTSLEHPDEMLSIRLKSLLSKCLIMNDFEFLSNGLEGRSTNRVSLLLDALLHPYADLGFELEPLLEFRKDGVEIDHIVFGRGPAGGIWHRIDPDILTLSLGSWMALPEIPFPSCTVKEKRAYARDVAEYYEKYIEKMNLKQYFKPNSVVTSVIKFNDQDIEIDINHKTASFLEDLMEKVKICIEPVNEMNNENLSSSASSSSPSFFTNAINCLLLRNGKRNRILCRRSQKTIHQEIVFRKKQQQPKIETNIILKHEKKRCCCCCCYSCQCNTNTDINRSTRNVPFYNRLSSSSCDLINNTNKANHNKWIVQSTDLDTNLVTTYSCKYLILACGSNDTPNRLEIFKNRNDPDYLVHDLRSLEMRLDKARIIQNINDPVLIVGAGLSAADAVMAVISRNIPVIHAFRGKSAEFTKQLPENMYPEYHQVHQMMNEGSSTLNPLYKAYPEHSLTDFDTETPSVKLTSKTGETIPLNVSFVAILIGSKPNLTFLPNNISLGMFKDKTIDSKTNPISINPFTYEVNNCEGLFAIGPLAGDNFVRFITGGAVAIVSELYKRMNLKVS